MRAVKETEETVTPKGNMEYLLLRNQIKRFALLFIPLDYIVEGSHCMVLAPHAARPHRVIKANHMTCGRQSFPPTRITAARGSQVLSSTDAAAPLPRDLASCVQQLMPKQ